jgi:predicted PurR-regulated permease PerM
MKNSFESIAQLAAIFTLVLGCYLVLKPFLAATLFATVVCVSTWPLYLLLLRKMQDRRNTAALTMTLSLVLVVILPLALVAWALRAASRWRAAWVAVRLFRSSNTVRLSPSWCTTS